MEYSNTHFYVAFFYQSIISNFVSEFATVVDFDFFVRLVAAIGTVVLNVIEYFPTRNNFAEDDVLAVEVGRINEGQEELRSIGVLSRVGHGQDAASSVLMDKVLIIERIPVD